MRPGTTEWLYERDVKRLTLRIPVEMHDAVITLSRATGRSANALACDAIHEYLTANGRWEKVEEWLRRTGERYRAGIAELESPVDRRDLDW